MNRQALDPAIIPAGWSSAMFPGFEEDSNSSCGSLGASALTLRTGESEDNEERLCSVCGDKANGYHFHVLTCEGCKGFFRRSIAKGLTFTCPFTRSCPVNKAKRRRCQACRLQKCLEVGMRKDMILSEEALMARRELRVRKKQERLQRTQRVVEAEPVSEEQKQLISILIHIHRKHFDTNFEHFVDYRPQPILKENRENFKQNGLSSLSPGSSPGATDQSPTPQRISGYLIEGDTLKEIPHFADLSTYMIHQVINFAKEIPDFRSLTIDDQISLLKGATMEVAHLQFNTVFNLETKTLECGRLKLNIEHGTICKYVPTGGAQCPWSYYGTIQQPPCSAPINRGEIDNAGFQRMYLEQLLKLHITLRKLKLHEAEYVLMQALALFSPDRPGVMEHNRIDKIQETIAMTLKCYIDSHHQLPGRRFLFAKLLSMLAELRTLNEENAKQMVHIQNVMEDAMTPLMKEIFS